MRILDASWCIFLFPSEGPATVTIEASARPSSMSSTTTGNGKNVPIRLPCSEHRPQHGGIPSSDSRKPVPRSFNMVKVETLSQGNGDGPAFPCAAEDPRVWVSFLLEYAINGAWKLVGAMTSLLTLLADSFTHNIVSGRTIWKVTHCLTPLSEFQSRRAAAQSIYTTTHSEPVPTSPFSEPGPSFFTQRHVPSVHRHYASNRKPVHRPAVLIGHDPIPDSARQEFDYRSLPRRHKSQLRILGPVLAACLFYWYYVEVVPVSGRRRFNCMSDWFVDRFGDVQYQTMMEDLSKQGATFLGERDPRSRMTMRVMHKLIPVSGIPSSQRWDIFIVDAPHVPNAAVIPGGKVIVFSGIFNFVKSDDALAAVLGHEIAHNLAGHVAERMSGNIGFNILLVGSLFVMSWAGPVALYFFGKPLMEFVVGMPMSRAQESEADYIGLMMMAEACYNPREARRFWERMDRVTKGEPPELLNTHPSHKNRITKIEKWMPQAIEKRENSQCTGTSHFADMLRRAFEQGYLIINE
ncbi:uncharacterized protein MKZ38_005156 [Zalerion maritima]|uniref:Peptidase M48 domain-containing protein n=1 Tax=Zalerion maritima TaxID=339359 RepID=A0AAD5RW82_9PEZI|nr:uncharacterized protein MKZ38_005156 [Zalerion maritima]